MHGYTRRIVGWAMDQRPTTKIVTDALKMALWRRRVVAGLMVHSDQGVQYRTGAYHRLLKTYGIECSMSRKGNCLDNAPMESLRPVPNIQWLEYYVRGAITPGCFQLITDLAIAS